MATESTTPVQRVPRTPLRWTTRRGFATSSFVLGFWATLTFWWYPFGLTVGLLATLMAVISIAMGWRAGKEGQHLAWFGLLFGGNGVGLAIFAFRFVQTAYEGTPPPLVQTLLGAFNFG